MRPVFADNLSTLVNWVQKDALPIWLAHGQNGQDGWFSAELSPDGVPPAGRPIQLVAQAQILYLLARAEHVGWAGGKRRVARDLIDFVGRHGTLPCRSDGYVRTLEAPSVVLDSRCDPVDHAWFVIANTACFAAFGEMSDLRRAYNILDWLHIHFTEGVTWKGVDRTTDAEPELYRYMLRAFLYLAEVTQKPAWQERAETLFRHCSEMFHLPMISHASIPGFVPAQFNWQEQLAWVRVMCRCQRVLGVGLTAAETLYGSELVQKHLPPSAGEKISGKIRAEAIAAGLALLAAGVAGAENWVAQHLDVFFNEYVVPGRPGLFVDEPWRDDAEGSVATLVRLFDAAILAQQVLAKGAHLR